MHKNIRVQLRGYDNSRNNVVNTRGNRRGDRSGDRSGDQVAIGERHLDCSN